MQFLILSVFSNLQFLETVKIALVFYIIGMIFLVI